MRRPTPHTSDTSVFRRTQSRLHGSQSVPTTCKMVSHQNSKKPGEFAVCLALRFGPENVEFGGISQVIGRDGLISNRSLGFVINGYSEGPQPISNQFE